MNKSQKMGIQGKDFVKVPYWIEALVPKIFLWRSFNEFSRKTGSIRPIQSEDNYPRIHLVAMKEVFDHLSKTIPVSTDKDGNLIDPFPGQQAEGNDGQVRKILQLTTHTKNRLRNYLGTKRFTVHEIPKKYMREKPYLLAIDRSRNLKTVRDEDWQTYPLTILDNYRQHSPTWSEEELRIALEIKELLGWSYRYDRPDDRRKWFLPHPITGRLIPGEEAVIKELALRNQNPNKNGISKDRENNSKDDAESEYLTPGNQDILTLLAQNPWRPLHSTADDIGTGEGLAWVKWGTTKHTKSIPAFAERYHYSPILLGGKTGKTSSAIKKKVTDTIIGFNELIAEYNAISQLSPGSTPSYNHLIERQMKALSLCLETIDEVKVKRWLNLEDNYLASFYDTHILPDQCFYAEATEFLRIGLLHCATHLNLIDQPIDSKSGETTSGIYCVVCRAYKDRAILEPPIKFCEPNLNEMWKRLTMPLPEENPPPTVKDREQYFKSRRW